MASYPPGTVVLDPGEVAVNRAELQLNEGSIRVGGVGGAAGIDWGTYAPTTYEAEQQKWGSSVVSFRMPNIQVTIPLLLGSNSSNEYQSSLQALREKVALFQREGGWVGRSSAGGINLYGDVVNATLALPDVYGEAAGMEPGVQLVLECLPDFYGDVVNLDEISGAGEVQAVLTQGGQQAVIAGDHPGRATVTVTDTSGNQQFGVLGAFQSRYYSPAVSAELAFPAASSLTPAAGASVQPLSGARGGEAISQPGCGTGGAAIGSGVFSHEGTFAVWCRVYCASAGASVQWQWGLGDSASSYENGVLGLPGAGFYLVNVGVVRAQPPAFGSPQWQGQLIGFSSSGTLDVWWDMLYLQPLDESAWQASGMESADPAVLADGSLVAQFNGVWRTTSFQGVYAPVPVLVGDLPRIAPSGAEGRACRLFCKPSRGDLSSAQDSASQDSFTVQVSYRPCYIGRL